MVPTIRSIAKSVKGYPPDAIARLEEALGRPAAHRHRDIPRTAAANVGFPHDSVCFDLEEVIELAADKRETMPSTFTPIAVDLSPSYSDYFMDLGRPVGKGDGAIVRSAAGSMAFDNLWYINPSLRDLLFLSGFEYVRKLTLPHRVTVSWAAGQIRDPSLAPRLTQLRETLVQLGFRSLDVTGPKTPLYERGDCAISVVQSMESEAFSVHVAAGEVRTVNVVAETICDNMPGQAVRQNY